MFPPRISWSLSRQPQRFVTYLLAHAILKLINCRQQVSNSNALKQQLVPAYM